MTMTGPQLQGLAAQALNLAKSDIRNKRWRACLIATYHEGEQLYRMRKIENLLEERLGEYWLNDDDKKDMGFGLLRMAFLERPPDAVMWVTGANEFRVTEKLRALPEEKGRWWLAGGHERHHQAVREGLMTIHDALVALAQSAELVCVYMQRVLPGAVFAGQPDVKFFPQADFDGRLKFYGTGKYTAPPPNFTKRSCQ